MPFVYTSIKTKKPNKQKAFIPHTLKQIALAYNSILCYLQAMCRKAFGIFSSKPNAAVKVVRQEEKKEKSILSEHYEPIGECPTKGGKITYTGMSHIPSLHQHLKKMYHYKFRNLISKDKPCRGKVFILKTSPDTFA